MLALSTTAKGAAAECRIAAEAIALGFLVSRPLGDGGRYDLVFDDGRELSRVQCKWAPRLDNVVVIRARSNRCTPRGYVRGPYRSHEVDAIAAFCPDVDRCYLVPIREIDGQSVMYLRLEPPMNNQKLGVKMAAAYELGAIAQLGERSAGSRKVEGSSPSSSTVEIA